MMIEAIARGGIESAMTEIAMKTVTGGIASEEIGTEIEIEIDTVVSIDGSRLALPVCQAMGVRTAFLSWHVHQLRIRETLG